MPRSSIQHDMIFTILKKSISILFSLTLAEIPSIGTPRPITEQKSYFYLLYPHNRSRKQRSAGQVYPFDADHRTFPEGLHPTILAMTSMELFAKDFLCFDDVIVSSPSQVLPMPEIVALTAAQPCKAVGPDGTPPRFRLVTIISKYVGEGWTFLLARPD